MSGAERFFLLLRHGIAEERSSEKRDFDRALTPEGSRRVKEVSKAIAKLFPKGELIVTSPLARCTQTALLVQKAFGRTIELRTSDLLTPDSSAREFRKLVDELTQSRVIFVGHEPRLTEAMLALTGLKGELELKKGGCYGVAMGQDGGSLEWILPPRVLRKL